MIEGLSVKKTNYLNKTSSRIKRHIWYVGEGPAHLLILFDSLTDTYQLPSGFRYATLTEEPELRKILGRMAPSGYQYHE